MLDVFKNRANRELLKYAAGRAIFCQFCKHVLDCKTTAIASKNSETVTLCTACLDRAALDNSYEIVDGRTYWPAAPIKAVKSVGKPVVCNVQGGTDPVPCKQRIGPFVIHRPLSWKASEGPYWTLTHESTGLAIRTMIHGLTTARRLARALDALDYDWTFTNPEKRDKGRDRDMVKAINAVIFG